MLCPPRGVSPQLRGLRRAVGGVAGILQFIGNQAHRQLLPGTHLARRRVDLCCGREHRLLEPFVHDALILEVVEAKDQEARHHHHGERQQRNAEQQRCPGMLPRGSCDSDSQRHRGSLANQPSVFSGQLPVACYRLPSAVSSSASSATRSFTNATTSLNATSTLVLVARVTSSTIPPAAFLPTLTR